jgi:cysteinyl-tRNA synthetase
MKKLKIYNSFSRELSDFSSIDPKNEYVGMYVCGPTVYNEVHLGNCRTFVSFDIVYRHLLHKGYKVRYVRNITDVGHLEGDADSGAESKIDQRARLERLEPMEIVQKYSNLFHHVMQQLNTLPPSIEPTATGHIVEQIEMVKQIIANGYGYEKNGSVYFNTRKLIEENKGYGTLSGKLVDDLLNESRDNLKNQDEKQHPSDFAIWVKASPSHIMRWPSPWGEGFPGWHLECSAMSTKYLGQTFDIHGGGMDLQFPHHENEIAQNLGACGCQPVRYWMHGNMLVLNGKKMSKSDGNYIMPRELFSGSSPLMTKAYSPMTLRFFMLQAHYRSTLNITEEAMQGAEKGLQRLMEANAILQELQYSGVANTTDLDAKINHIIDAAFDEMDNDFNTPNALAELFGLVSEVQKFHNKQQSLNLISEATLNRLKDSFKALIFDVFGLMDETAANDSSAEMLDGLMQMIIEFRKEAREQKNWAKSDLIRDELLKLGVQIKDGKEGASWSKL